MSDWQCLTVVILSLRSFSCLFRILSFLKKHYNISFFSLHGKNSCKSRREHWNMFPLWIFYFHVLSTHSVLTDLLKLHLVMCSRLNFFADFTIYNFEGWFNVLLAFTHLYIHFIFLCPQNKILNLNSADNDTMAQSSVVKEQIQTRKYYMHMFQKHP